MPPGTRGSRRACSPRRRKSTRRCGRFVPSLDVRDSSILVGSSGGSTSEHTRASGTRNRQKPRDSLVVPESIRRAQLRWGAVRREWLKGPGRGGVELGPIDLLLQPMERLVADRALLAQPVQRQSLGRDRAQAEPVVLGRALWLLRARGHLARGEVPFADGRRRGRALSRES